MSATQLLHSAIKNNNLEAIEDVLLAKTPSERVLLLSERSEDGELPLFTAESPETVEMLLRFVDIEDRLKLLIRKDGERSDTVLHQAAHRHDTSPAMVGGILNMLSLDDRVKLLQQQNPYTDTVLHIAAFYHSKPDTIQCVLDSVEPNKRYQVLTLTEQYGETPLHKAVYNQRMPHVQCLLNSIEPNERLLLFNVKDRFQLNALQKQPHNLPIVLEMIRTIDPRQRLELLLVSDKHGDTILHKAAGTGAEAMQAILDLLEPEARHEILKYQNIYGKTCLHSARSSKPIFDSMHTPQRVALLRIQDNDGSTILHRLVERSYTYDAHVVKHILLPVGSEDTLSLLTIRNVVGDTILHKAVKTQSATMIKSILSSVNGQHTLDLITIKNCAGNTSLHQVDYICTDAILVMIELLNQNQRVSALQQTDDDGFTPLHKAADGNAPAFKRILSYVKKEDRFALYMLRAKSRGTPLHVAAENGSTEIIQYVLENLEDEQRLKLLRSTSRLGASVLHVIITKQDVATFNYILQIISLPSILDILEISAATWSKIEEAMNQHNTSKLYDVMKAIGDTKLGDIPALLKLLGRDVQEVSKMVDIINMEFIQSEFSEINEMDNKELKAEIPEMMESRYAHGNTLLHMIVEHGDVSLLKRFLACMISRQRNKYLSFRNQNSLTPYDVAKTDDIRQLLQWSEKQTNFYYLPTPPVVLIMYSTKNRKQADDECQSLEQVLPEFNLNTTVRKDPTKEQMLDEIKNAQNADISALIVIIMSHGAQGVVEAADGTVKIHDILQKMGRSYKMWGKPKVLLIQACQPKLGRPPDSSTSEGSKLCPSNSTDTHFDIPKRDFAVLAAAIPGGYALHNTMIPIFARQLQDSDNSDIHEVFLKTHQELERISEEQRLRHEQVPVYRTTLKYKLSLRNIFKSE